MDVDIGIDDDGVLFGSAFGMAWYGIIAMDGVVLHLCVCIFPTLWHASTRQTSTDF